ncbi:hypothetical protein MTR67_042825 [Solanum verrucosum]|uniref:Uncharacterized protein n=1 Tax=Solanum verrucosum TaxID=315347 RepID=A0AAF0UP75_SOLVR|nr:hypothetical protein MTR67_042825 [Solanum verrucosum]
MKQYEVLKSWSRLYRINLVAGLEQVVEFSSPFISAHLAQTPHSNTLLVWRYVDTCNKENYSLFQDSKNQTFSLDFTSELNIPFKCQQGYFTIVCSCKGIVCLSDDLCGQLRSLVLWNPSIQKFLTLPFPSIKPESPHMSILGLYI